MDGHLYLLCVWLSFSENYNAQITPIPFPSSKVLNMRMCKHISFHKFSPFACELLHCEFLLKYIHTGRRIKLLCVLITEPGLTSKLLEFK